MRLASDARRRRLRDLPIRVVLTISFVLVVTGTLALLGSGTFFLVRTFLWQASRVTTVATVRAAWSQTVGVPAGGPPPLRRPHDRLLFPFWWVVVRPFGHHLATAGPPAEDGHGPPSEGGHGPPPPPDGPGMEGGRPPRMRAHSALRAPDSLPARASALISAIQSSPFLFARILDTQGHVLAETAGRGHLAPPARALLVSGLTDPMAVDHGEAIVEDDGYPWHVLLMPIVRTDDAVVGWLQVAGPWSMYQHMLWALAVYLCFCGVLAVVLGWVASVWLARTLSTPLERLAEAACDVREGRLQVRTGLIGGRNEVYRVASAFDAMVERLQAVFASQKRFVADASHELRTPVTAIRSMAEALQMGADQGDAEARYKALGAVIKETERMQGLMESLLTLSRAERERANRARISVSDVVGDLVAEQHLLGIEQNLGVDMVPDLYVAADEEQLRCVVRNLLDNAVTYTPPDGHIRVTGVASEGSTVLRVSDTGCGIAAESLPHVFERFYRADASRCRRRGGSGLGLSIVEALVKEMGGEVSIRSMVGQGTEVCVRLPQWRESVPRETAVSTSRNST